ncbi:MAG TPA: tudor domain-containing protein [Acidimicrobiales bacterium]|nr:tudor domain-containing protein [Acidimicrobiales bacterium]
MRRRRDGQQRGGNSTALAKLGLSAGDRVRFRRRDGGRWREGVVSGIHKDGSVALHDEDGRARAITSERLELRTTGPRGATTWEPLPEHAARPEQLRLL